MRTSAGNAISSRATSADVPHTDCMRARRPFYLAESAGARLERRPSMLLSLPHTTMRALALGHWASACAAIKTGANMVEGGEE